MNEDKTITMEILSFIKYKDECYEVGEIIKHLLNKLDEKNDEIERLNNIINELEKELDRGYRDLFEHELVPGRELITNIKNYLQELKGVDKE